MREIAYALLKRWAINLKNFKNFLDADWEAFIGVGFGWGVGFSTLYLILIQFLLGTLVTIV
jgi:hypothetical protein